jgi:hypothetical protein
MKRILAAAIAAGFVSACAMQQASKEPTTKTEQQRIMNLGYFDVANCELQPPATPDKVNEVVLTGVLLSARPYALECLVDPKHRGTDKTTQVVVDSTLGEAGLEHKVTGTNLTPEGAACVQQALTKYTSAMPNLAKNSVNQPPPPPAAAPAPAPTAKGKKAPPAPPPAAPATPPAPVEPVKAHVEFQHSTEYNPSVTFGANEGSDVVGTVRMAIPTWCDCFEPWKNAPPSPLRAAIKISNPAQQPADKKQEKKDDAAAAAAAPAATDGVTPTEVNFDPITDPNAEKVSACLKGKIMALKFKPPAGQYIQIPYPMRFVNANVNQPLGDSPPDLQFVQFDLLRNDRTADSAIAVGQRVYAEAVYNKAVERYKATANSKKGPEVTVKELQDKCAALIKADDAVISQMKAQLEVETATHVFAQAQAAKDKAWAEAETASAKQVADAQKDVATWEAARKADEGACPKVKY